MSKFCQFCGSPVADEARFCSACGRPAAPQNNQIPAQPNPPRAAQQNVQPPVPQMQKPKKSKVPIILLSVVSLLLVGVIVVILLLGEEDKAKTGEADRQDSQPSERSSETQPAVKNIVGDVITFGTYEQDNDTSDGKEPIEWIVVDQEGDRVLIVSKYALDCQPYNTELVPVTWETCSLRGWLNGSFLSTAFSTQDQQRIRTTDVSVEPESSSRPQAPKTVSDKVFILSVSESNTYFGAQNGYFGAPKKVCAPTAYAVAQGVMVSDGYTTEDGDTAGQWWVRGLGKEDNHADYVDCTGAIVSQMPFYVTVDMLGVRPALWIDLDF